MGFSWLHSFLAKQSKKHKAPSWKKPAIKASFLEYNKTGTKLAIYLHCLIYYYFYYFHFTGEEVQYTRYIPTAPTDSHSVLREFASVRSSPSGFCLGLAGESLQEVRGWGAWGQDSLSVRVLLAGLDPSQKSRSSQSSLLSTTPSFWVLETSPPPNLSMQ